MTDGTNSEVTQREFNLLDLLEATMAIGYKMGLRDETLEDAASAGEYILATALIEASCGGDIRSAINSEAPPLRFTAEWRSVIDELLGGVIPDWERLEPEWDGDTEHEAPGSVHSPTVETQS